MNSEKTGAPTLPRQGALSSWENEGGAPAQAPQAGAKTVEPAAQIPLLTNAELVQLRVRVIALENVIIALLSKGSDEQLRLVGELATYISPRPGYTPHPLTIRASNEMLHLVDRATHFRGLAVP
ncbi:MAG TPA: hypothetical protein VGM97_16425 [Steroidobacteraceae bacterium]|jgi:hypothetical protein